MSRYVSIEDPLETCISFLFRCANPFTFVFNTTKCMLSALLELLPSISTKECSSSLDFIALLVSAYPDLQPWCVHEATVSSEHSGDFYLKYMSSLLNHEDGNDAAKRDEALVKVSLFVFFAQLYSSNQLLNILPLCML